MRKGWVVGLSVLLVLAGLVAGCGGKGNTTTGSGEAVPVSLAEAKVGRLSRGDILSGKVVAAAEINLVPKTAGKVGAVPVDVGSRVRAGQVVLRLDAPELEAAVRQAEAGVAAARAQLKQAQLGVARAEAALRQAEDSYRLAEANYKRGQFLLDQQSIAQADFESRFEQPYLTAKAGLDQARAAYQQAVDQRDSLVPAQIKQAQAALAVAQANFQNTIVVSPIDGVVAARYADPGELVSPQTPVLTIINIDKVVVEAGASEQQVNKLREGQKVRVFISAVRAEPFAGVISSISPAADARTKMYTVKVEIPNPQHLIKPGMFAEIDLGVSGEAILVPRDAVVTRDDTTAVFVVAGGKAVLRKVETGPSDGRNIAIERGLRPGEEVVVAGQERLENGTKVTVAEAGS